MNHLKYWKLIKELKTIRVIKLQANRINNFVNIFILEV